MGHPRLGNPLKSQDEMGFGGHLRTSGTTDDIYDFMSVEYMRTSLQGRSREVYTNIPKESYM